MKAEEKVEDKSLILSDPRGVTTQASNLARRDLNLIQSDRTIRLTLKSPQVVFNSLGMAFSLIPAGEFIMGESKSALMCHLPCHRVKISQPFYLSTHLVTQAQWEAVMGSNPSYFPRQARASGGRPLSMNGAENWDKEHTAKFLR